MHDIYYRIPAHDEDEVYSKPSELLDPLQSLEEEGINMRRVDVEAYDEPGATGEPRELNGEILLDMLQTLKVVWNV